MYVTNHHRGLGATIAQMQRLRQRAVFGGATGEMGSAWESEEAEWGIDGGENGGPIIAAPLLPSDPIAAPYIAPSSPIIEGPVPNFPMEPDPLAFPTEPAGPQDVASGPDAADESASTVSNLPEGPGSEDVTTASADPGAGPVVTITVQLRKIGRASCRGRV